MLRRLTTVWIMLAAFVFQNAAFAMPCCYGMFKTAGQAMLEQAQIHEVDAEHAKMSDCGHEMQPVKVDSSPEPLVDSASEASCPVAAAAPSGPSAVFLTSPSSSPVYGAQSVMSGHVLTLTVEDAPFRLERPPKHS